MFHRYVIASSGRKIDFDRAMWLMDKELFCQARDSMDREPIPDEQLEADMLGTLWRKYSSLHLEKYGVHFAPDVSSTWDS